MVILANLFAQTAVLKRYFFLFYQLQHRVSLGSLKQQRLLWFVNFESLHRRLENKLRKNFLRRKQISTFNFLRARIIWIVWLWLVKVLLGHFLKHHCNACCCELSVIWKHKQQFLFADWKQVLRSGFRKVACEQLCWQQRSLIHDERVHLEAGCWLHHWRGA